MNVEERWRCGCGFTLSELEDSAPCTCGLNPLEGGTWQRFRVDDQWCMHFVRELGDLAMSLRMLGWKGSDAEALGLAVGDMGSLSGRWTMEVLVPTEAANDADVYHLGRSFRYVRRGDEASVPWFRALSQGRPVFCTSPQGGTLMLVDAFVLVGPLSERVLFLVGHPFAQPVAEA